MRIMFIIFLLTPCFGNAANSIVCHFSKHHQANHAIPEESSYAAIDKSLEIVGTKTSQETLELSENNKATYSTNWVLLSNNNRYKITYAGNSGVLLSIENNSEERPNELSGWHNAQIVYSGLISTNTLFGKCLLK